MFFVYLDIILIHSLEVSNNGSHVHQVLKRLLEHLLLVKFHKWEFINIPSPSWVMSSLKERSEWTFPSEMKAVLDWPTPASGKEVQKFLGFANFYHK